MGDKGKIQLQGSSVKSASRKLALAPGSQRSEGLLRASAALVAASDEILDANEGDISRAASTGMAPAGLDRLRLDQGRIDAMAAGLRNVAALPDPVGEVADGWVRPNGLSVRRVRVPLGVVGVIYENRPNVTADAAGLCIRSGNAAFLRGSSAAIGSNRVIVSALRSGLTAAFLPSDSVALVDDTSRQSAVEFMQMRDVIDCLVPRGGPGLIVTIREHATVPFILDGDGNCHVYIDRSADLEMAERIVVNSKTQRPGVCNAAESLLVHSEIAGDFIPRVAEAMSHVELLGDERTRAVLASARPATTDDFATEFLDLKMTVAVVDDIDQAIEHITRFGTGHSEAIVTMDLVAARRFTREVDAAAVLVNASTRFVDGAELGFGAEIGISTQKLHCRGPMGLRELTTLKYVVEGTGHTRA